MNPVVPSTPAPVREDGAGTPRSQFVAVALAVLLVVGLVGAQLLPSASGTSDVPAGAPAGTAPPVPSPDQDPSPTSTPEPTPDPTPDPTPTGTPAPTAAPTGTPTAQPSARPTTTPKATPRPGPKPAPKPAPAPTGRVVGRVVDVTGAGIAHAKVAVFTQDWQWLREVKARRTGRFTVTGLAPGSYRLQASDSRSAWRTDRRAPTDATVRVRARQDSLRTITLRKGAFVTGQVTRSRQDRPAARALVRATDEYGRTFEVRSDQAGRFALGGLPRGTYRLWGYDAQKRWTGRTVRVGRLVPGEGKDLRVRMRTRAGAVNGMVTEGPRLARRTTWVTAINRSTGQWWVVKVRSGDLSIRGLAPGRYTLVVSGTTGWAPRTIQPRTKVRSGRTSNLTLRLTRRR